MLLNKLINKLFTMHMHGIYMQFHYICMANYYNYSIILPCNISHDHMQSMSLIIIHCTPTANCHALYNIYKYIYILIMHRQVKQH